mgnify:FL=1
MGQSQSSKQQDGERKQAQAGDELCEWYKLLNMQGSGKLSLQQS